MQVDLLRAALDSTITNDLITVSYACMHACRRVCPRVCVTGVQLEVFGSLVGLFELNQCAIEIASPLKRWLIGYVCGCI